MAVVDSTFNLSLCPRCEEGVVTTAVEPQDLDVGGTTIRLAEVRVDRCRRCGFVSQSGREVRLFEVLFATDYADTGELVAALRRAGYHGMFLRESEDDHRLAFADRDYVGGLDDDLRDIYLDNESGHVIGGLDARAGRVPIEIDGCRYTVILPKIGEGENGVVYDFEESATAVLKVAKPRPYSRDHIRQECDVTAFFSGHGIPVAAIEHADPFGSFVVKERLAGRSLAVLYDDLGAPGGSRHRAVRAAVEGFVTDLIRLFRDFPEAKTSVSPNNIFVVEENGSSRCLLVDTGPAPLHDYADFDFDEYWTVTVPRKIQQYRTVGYI